jgi:hypothetical protein
MTVPRACTARAPSVGAVAVLVACSGGPGAPPPDATTLDAFRADAPPPGQPHFDVGPRRGRIEVMEVRGPTGQPGQAELQAVLAAQPTVAQFVFYARIGVMHWQAETARVGECRLLEPRLAFCTICDGLCVATEVCEPYPTYGRAGDLTFTGVRAGPFTLTQASGVDPTWYASQGELGTDAFAPDATITVRAPGDTVPALEVSAGAVPPLADQLPETLELTDTTDLRVAWTPTDGDARVRLRLNSNNAGHGQPYLAVIECDSPDDGEIVIDRSLVETFPSTFEMGACEGSDCPPSTLTRYRSGSADVAGAVVDLVVGSRRDFWILRR